LTKTDNKDKLRVYEYAKSLNMSSKEIITILKRLNIPVNNHMSVMEEEAVSGVEKFFRDIKANAAAKLAAQESAAAQKRQQAALAESRSERSDRTDRSDRPASSHAGDRNRPGGQRNTNQRDRQHTPSGQSNGAGSSNGTSGASGGSAAQSRPAGSNRPPYDRDRNNGGNRDFSRNNSGRPQGQRPGSSQGQTGGQPPRSNPAAQHSGQAQGQQQGQPGQNSYANRGAGGSSGSAGQQSFNNRPRPQDNQQRRRPPGAPQAAGTQSQAASQPAKARSDQPRRTDNRGGRPFGGESNPRNRQGEQAAPVLRGNEPKPNFPRGVPAKAFEDTDDSANKAAKKPRPVQKPGGNTRPGQQGRQSNRSGRGRNNQQQQIRKEKVDNTPKKVIVRGTMTTGDLAKLLHKDVSEVIKKLLFLGAMVTINQELDLDTILLLASDYGIEVELKIKEDEDNFELIEEKDEEADLQPRPPVVTIMGHVDHGKTTLLDAIRHTNVTEGEAGGITQHIGAYQVETNGKKITFLDTPGHEAFTTMRSRGAQVTDITILVVAADDGVMPQTVEAINHAKAANVPIIVAVNKIDKPDANPDKIKQGLTEYGLVPEEWGGETVFANVSAKQRIGLDHLLEMILLVAEVQELKANPDKRARGTVIEAELDKGRGPVAHVLIQHGTLKVGDAFVAGVCFGRIRTMVNDKGKRLKTAGPSTPIEITGLTEVPQAGDPFLVYEDERKARAIADRRATTHRQSELGANTRVTLDDLYKQIKEGEMKDLNVIIKADVQGSVEALKGSLEKIEVEGARVKILHNGVGAITESDIILASASNAIIIGFNVRPEPAANSTAEQEKVDIRLHRVIYHVTDEIEAAMKGLLDPIYKENVIGHAEVRNIFKVSKVGTIAGCMVTSGKISRSAEARLIRNGIVIHEGSVDTLKRFKDDAKEVSQGYECGITLERFNDIKEGDIIEAFVMETVER
jgi:translation initiation factor IF-2